MKQDGAPVDDAEGIAVVGMSARFPGAGNYREFWENLVAARETVSFFSREELAEAGCDVASLSQRHVPARALLEDVDLFDAPFFACSTRSAEMMDPQHRLMLETAYEALEDAGYAPKRMPAPVGVFVGSGPNTYFTKNLMTRPELLEEFGEFPALLSTGNDYLSTRLSYLLNLRGPSLTVQTACSTSLVAVAQACQSLLFYQCDFALAGAVSVAFPQKQAHLHQEGGIYSADGHCRPFDAEATGTVFGDGVGLVALRRLSDALADGDPIHAVIKGFALNNDGSDKSGYSAPSVSGQAEVIEMAQAMAGVSPDTIGYVEAHGTATPLGDPIEISALTRAFRRHTNAAGFCAIGSVKGNIGHSDIAAGMAGLIKTILALKHGVIPPSINYSQDNPRIDFSSTPFYVADKIIDWTTREGLPKRAGVSAFGIGGTNAHMVLQEAPRLATVEEGRPWHILPLSARSPEAVDRATRALSQHRKSFPGQSLADTAYTLQASRSNFSHRRFFVCSDGRDADDQLESADGATHRIKAPKVAEPSVVFMFPGQGAQRVGMGKELYDREQVYKTTVDRCSEILEPEIGLDLRDVLYPPPDQMQWAEDRIVETRTTQPALFVTELALARLLISWGIEPAAMIGHSVGEFVAACVSDVFSLEDALHVIAARGKLIQEQPGGAMLAVALREEGLAPLLSREVSIAAVNAPELCVASGPFAAIDDLQGMLAEGNVTCRRLRTSHAFHSEMMQPAVEPFLEALEHVVLRSPKIPYVSNVAGQWVKDDEARDPQHWARHLRGSVRFCDGMGTLSSEPGRVLLEVGPGSTLTSLARQCGSGAKGVPPIACMPGQENGGSDYASALRAIGMLWQSGVEVKWQELHRGERRCRVSLPTYPFERKRYFVEPHREPKGSRSDASGGVPPRAADRGSVPEFVSVAMAEDRHLSSGQDRSDAVLSRLHSRLRTLSGLSVEEMGLDTTFQELGFDSLFLVQVSRDLEAEFGVPLTFGQLIREVPTLAKLAKHIEALLPPDQLQRGPVSALPSAPMKKEFPSATTSPDELADFRGRLRVIAEQLNALATGVGASRNGE